MCFPFQRLFCYSGNFLFCIFMQKIWGIELYGASFNSYYKINWILLKKGIDCYRLSGHWDDGALNSSDISEKSKNLRSLINIQIDDKIWW